MVKMPIAATKDPRGTSDAIMHYSQMWKNGKFYNAEVLYDRNTNTVLHIRYSRDVLGPLKEIQK